MPSISRFPLLSVIVASSAAAGGLLGAFVAVGLLAPPSDDKHAALPSPQAVNGVSETNRAASPGDNVAVGGCDQQTWPHLSRPCMEELQRKNRTVRVITTDRLDQPTMSAIESQPKPREPGADQGQAAVVAAQPAAVPDPAIGAEPEPVPVATSVPVDKPAVQSVQAVKSDNVPTQPTAPAPNVEHAAAQTPPVPTAAVLAQEDLKSKPKPSKKSKRKSKPKFEDDETAGVASAGADDRADDERASAKRSRKVVERWTERRYDDGRWRRDDGDHERRVVIRRSGGFMENLFGFGRANTDEE